MAQPRPVNHGHSSAPGAGAGDSMLQMHGLQEEPGCRGAPGPDTRERQPEWSISRKRHFVTLSWHRHSDKLRRTQGRCFSTPPCVDTQVCLGTTIDETRMCLQARRGDAGASGRVHACSASRLSAEPRVTAQEGKSGTLSRWQRADEEKLTPSTWPPTACLSLFGTDLGSCVLIASRFHASSRSRQGIHYKINK